LWLFAKLVEPLENVGLLPWGFVADLRGARRGDHFAFHFHVDFHIDVGGIDVGMP